MKMPVEIEIMKKTACDAVKKNYFRFAVCILEQIINYLEVTDPVDPVIERTDERQEEEMEHERDYLEKN